MAKQNRILYAAIFGTTAMTLFSYIFSATKNRNLKEPKLLGKMIHPLIPGIGKNSSRQAGWAVHYAVGLLFVEMYAQIWQRTSIKANKRTGLIFGGLSGIAAILIWKFTLAIHPDPPSVHFKKHALNLFIAHVIFGFFTVMGYNR
jgi:hypothetical protein